MNDSHLNKLATFAAIEYRSEALEVMEHANEILESAPICAMLEKWHELYEDNMRYRVQSLIDFAKSDSDYFRDCCRTNYEYYNDDDADEMYGFSSALSTAIHSVID